MARKSIIFIVLFLIFCRCNNESTSKSYSPHADLEKLVRISQKLSQVGQWHLSLQINHIILDVIRNSKSDKKNGLLARAYIQSGINLRYMEKYDLSLEAFLKCLEICKKQGLEREKGTALYHIGDLAYLDWAYFRKKNTDEALDYVQQSLAIRNQISDSTGISESLYRLGTIYQINGEHARAKEIFDRSLNIAIGNKDTTGMIDSYTHLAGEYQRLGDLDSAISYHERAYVLASSQNNNYLEAHSLNNLGGLLLELQRLDEATQKINTALVLSEEIGNAIVLCKSYYYMGQLLKQMRKLDKSREYFQKGLTLAKETGYKNYIDAFHQSLPD